MALEVEIKIPVDNLEAVIKQLKQEGRVGEITLDCWNANELSRYQAINDNYGLNAKIVVNKPLDYFVKQ